MKGITPIIAIVLLLLMTVAAAGSAYLWFTSTQGRIQQQVSGRITSTGSNIQFQIVGLECKNNVSGGLQDNVSFYIRNQGDSIANDKNWVITLINAENDATLDSTTFNLGVATGGTNSTTVSFANTTYSSGQTIVVRLNAPGGGEQSATCTVG